MGGNYYFISNHEYRYGICIQYIYDKLTWYMYIYNDDKLTILILFIFQVIFITEYMSSGSLSQFMKKTRKNNKTFNLKVL